MKGWKTGGLMVTSIVLGGLWASYAPLLALSMLVFLALCLVPVCVQWIEGSFQPFRPDVFLAAVWALYTLPLPISVLLDGDGSHDPGNLTVGMLLSVTALVGLLVGYYAVSGVERDCRQVVWRSVATPLAWVSPWVLIALGASMFLVFTIVMFGGPLDYVTATTRLERFEGASGRGYLTIGVYVLSTGWALLLARGFVKSRSRSMGRRAWLIPHLFFALLYGGYFLSAGDRRQLVGLGLSLLCVAMVFVRVNWTVVAIPSVLGIFILHIFSKVRGYAADPRSLVEAIGRDFSWSWFDLSTGELGAPMKVLTKVLEIRDSLHPEYGSTYLYGVAHLLPSRWSGGLPQLPTRWFAEQFHNEAYWVGGGVGFSFVAEAILNFGWIGPFMVGTIFGIALGMFWRFCMASHPTDLRVTLYASSLLPIYYLVRADFGSVLNLWVFASLVPICIAASIDRVLSIAEWRRPATTTSAR